MSCAFCHGRQIADKETRYSLSELDAMRSALLRWCGADREFPGEVDETLRTYMLSGATASEVIQHAEDREAAAWKLREQWAGEP